MWNNPFKSSWSYTLITTDVLVFGNAGIPEIKDKIFRRKDFQTLFSSKCYNQQIQYCKKYLENLSQTVLE